jgi:hypothetical protein
MLPTTPAVFLSHSSKDTARLRDLVASLKTIGIRVWFDADDIGLGDAISRRMSEGLSTSDRLLVAWSNHAASSEHVWNEIDAFYIRRPKPGFMVFLRLDDTPIPTLYAARAYVDANGETGALTQAIAAWASGQPSNGFEVGDADNPVSDNLHMFPRGPMVKLYLITDALVNAFAESAATQAKATALIHKSIRLRLEADPDDARVTTIALAGLPSFNHAGAYDFWQEALFEACKHGPRMLAALLFSQPDDLFPPLARTDRAKLIQHLRRLNHQSEDE